jgi:hypothetical protein
MLGEHSSMCTDVLYFFPRVYAYPFFMAANLKTRWCSVLGVSVTRTPPQAATLIHIRMTHHGLYKNYEDDSSRIEDLDKLNLSTFDADVF